jgi:hypothetical protein
MESVDGLVALHGEELFPQTALLGRKKFFLAVGCAHLRRVSWGARLG